MAKKSAWEEAVDTYNRISSGVRSGIGQAVQNFTQPSFTSPVPNPIHQPQRSFQMPNIQSAFWNKNNPIAVGALNAQKFINSPVHTTIVPTIKPFNQNTIPANIGNTLANIPGGIINTVVGQGIIDPAIDVGRLAGARLTNQNIPAYKDLKSGTSRLAYNIMGEQRTPQQVLGNLGDIATPILFAHGGGKVFGIGTNATKAIEATLPQAIKTGVFSGIKTGGLFGIASGLSEGRNDTLINQILKSGERGVEYAAVGAVLGGVVGGVGNLLGRYRSLTHRNAKVDAELKARASAQPRDANGQWVRTDLVKPKGMSNHQWKRQLAFNSKWNRNPYEPVYPSDVNKAIEIELERKGVGLSIRDVSKERKFAEAKFSDVSGGQKPSQLARGAQQKILQEQKAFQKNFPNLSNAEQKTLSLPSEGNIAPKQPKVKFSGKQRGFITTVKESRRTVPQVAKEIEGTYAQITNKQTLKEAQKLVDTNIDEAIRIVKSPEPPTAKTYAVAQDLIRRYQNQGRYNEAVELVESVSRRATNQGQAIQALSMWNRLTPEGALRYSQSLIEKANQTRPNKPLVISSQQAQKITTLAKEAQKMTAGREKIVKTAELVEAIHEVVPPGLLQKISAIQTMAQLLNPKTAIRNVGGNLGFQVGENVSQTVATPIDIVTSVFTGKRTTTLPKVGAQVKGFKLGLKEGVEDALKGVNTSGITTQFDLPKTKTFSKGVMGGLEKTLNIELRATDRAFYKSAYEQSIANQLRVAKINGQNITKPTEQMIEQAHYEGLYRTFQDENVVSKLFVSIKKALNLGKHFGLGDIVLKYPKTPGNLVARGIEYSPAGFANTIFQMAKPLMGQSFNQKTFVDAFSRAIVGSAGLVTTGAILNKLGIISGKGEKDTDINAVQQAMGMGQYRINASALKRFVLSGFNTNSAKPQTGDKLVTYDWFQPFAVAISMGANIAENNGKATGLVDTFLSSIEGGVETLYEQPLVRGLTSLFKGYNPVDAFIQTLQQLPSSFTPGIISQVNQATDNTVRNTHSPDKIEYSLNLAKSRIPGLAQTLPEKYTVFGDVMKRYEDNNLFNVFLNPAFVNTLKENPAGQEVLDIFERSGETQQAPRVVDKSVKINGNQKQLTGEEQSRYQQYIGTKTKEIFDQLVQDDTFKLLEDEEKAKKMANILTDINSAAKIELFGNNPKTLSSGAKAVIKGNYSISGKQIDISEPIEYPALTGNAELDKKLISKYKSALTKRGNDIVELYKEGMISADEAEKLLNELKIQSTKTSSVAKAKKGRKPAKITARRVSARKLSVANILKGDKKILRVKPPVKPKQAIVRVTPKLYRATTSV